MRRGRVTGKTPFAGKIIDDLDFCPDENCTGPHSKRMEKAALEQRFAPARANVPVLKASLAT
jgi:hypothetical protein